MFQMVIGGLSIHAQAQSTRRVLNNERLLNWSSIVRVFANKFAFMKLTHGPNNITAFRYRM
ncbi:MAG TPA: hypothetical protein VK085_00375 [Pseudogracilibacillus sp.]|nr:hypothetical protein [Pseudogracilibacillus sp.]